MAGGPGQDDPTPAPLRTAVGAGHEGEPLLRRHREVVDLRRTLATARLVTLTGPGGIGKTTLARAAAVDHQRVRREATWTVDLADLVDPGLLGHSVAAAFGLQLPYGAAAAEDVATALADRVGLLVLDGCEAMFDAAVALVAVLLPRAPRLRVLATSQRHLGVTGEVVVPLGPLSSDEARALFTARAVAALPSFRVTEDNAATIAELCDALEGVPLAVELAAARVLVLSPQQILDRLAERQRLLAKGARGAPARQRSLRASLEASSELCTPSEQLLWARLSVFVGGFSLEAAETVCVGDGIDETDVLDLVDGLVEKSVLVREDDGASYSRFRMLESLREYAAGRLDVPQRVTVLDRHLDWYADLVRAATASWFGPDQVGWYRTLRREHGNLREALRHALSDPQHSGRALEMLTALEPYWVVTGQLGEARHWLSRASAGTSVDANTQAAVLAMAAWTATLQGEPEAARTMVDEAEGLVARGAVDDGVRGRVLVASAIEASWRGSPAEALAPLEQAVALARTAGDRSLESTATLVLGLCCSFAGHPDRAGEVLQQCVDLTREAGEIHVRSYALAALGMLSLLDGAPEAAAELGRQALTMTTDLGDRLASAFILEVLAWVAAAERRPERAGTLLGAARARWRQLGVEPDDVPYLSAARRSCDERVGLDRADAELRAALRIGDALPDEQVLALALEQASSPVEAPLPAPLTPREVDVAQLVGRGLSNREIADQLSISQRTVESHVDHILRKLGFGSRTQVVAWVIELESAGR